MEFIEAELGRAGCPAKELLRIRLATEEIFVNIANYAYEGKDGKAEISLEITKDPDTAVITFSDSGVPFDPLTHEDPDISLPADQRAIGGLGIFIVKKNMDDVKYAYVDGRNVLTIKKVLRG